MATLPIDTSLAGYKSGSTDRQDDIYRNRQRPQPYPLTQADSGYESATHLHVDKVSTSSSPSLLSLANLVKCDELLKNDSNFASETVVDCYESDFRSIKQQRLNESAFHDHLSTLAVASQGGICNRILLFFATLECATGATFNARSSFSKAAVDALINGCNLNTLFVPDLLGKPRYLAAELYSISDRGGALESIDFFCQQPRFVIHGPGFVQRAPVSIYMRYEVAKNLTYYIISAPESEDGVNVFKNLLNLASHDGSELSLDRALLQHPLEAHIFLSKILCESSQSYIHQFRQSMFAQLRKVDELSIQESADRKALATVTIELQIISKDVNKLLGDIDVASRNLDKTQEALTRLDQQHGQNFTLSNLPSGFPFPLLAPPVHDNLRRQLIETLQYLQSSMDKQKMWLNNYRDRKDIAMSLVFNLVTQQDAANNIGIAKEMKRDSSSMNGIALLTMVFLPGTFTSTILGAGIFSSFAQNRDIHVSGLWWFWAAITFPLTGVVLLLWIIFCWRKEIEERWARMMIGMKASRRDDIDVEAKG